MILRPLRVDDEREAIRAQELLLREGWPFPLGYLCDFSGCFLGKEKGSPRKCDYVFGEGELVVTR